MQLFDIVSNVFPPEQGVKCALTDMFFWQKRIFAAFNLGERVTNSAFLCLIFLLQETGGIENMKTNVIMQNHKKKPPFYAVYILQQKNNLILFYGNPSHF